MHSDRSTVPRREFFFYNGHVESVLFRVSSLFLIQCNLQK